MNDGQFTQSGADPAPIAKLHLVPADWMYSFEVPLTMNERALLINALLNYSTEAGGEQEVLQRCLDALDYHNEAMNAHHQTSKG